MEPRGTAGNEEAGGGLIMKQIVNFFSRLRGEPPVALPEPKPEPKPKPNSKSFREGFYPLAWMVCPQCGENGGFIVASLALWQVNTDGSYIGPLMDRSSDPKATCPMPNCNFCGKLSDFDLRKENTEPNK